MDDDKSQNQNQNQNQNDQIPTSPAEQPQHVEPEQPSIVVFLH